ncbi:hypothetical protein P691DRAFT_811291 [Macrolepiota fuliginosa MF-IS2]|uniref:Cupredoxin n=1 Tax=Macrolepiota fuliginosa MF-IS2 TaxID=1400762 RepID=A0A9P5X195_9AGAR|nr:hypothetical protein P691DRAFT_811291 [Macrolepiota fuliginosa MF-IS2]
MYFATVLTSLTFLGLALAQSNSTNSTKVVTIQVGSTASAPGGIFQFIPNNVTASNGTVINFQFTGMPGNHSITQAKFSDPCTPMDGGFDSGWVLLPTTGLSPVPEWNLTITDDSKPIWFFCKQLIPAPHCPAGMVGAINAPSSGNNTFAAFKSAAAAVKTTPGQNENGLVGVGASASVRPSPIPSGATAFPDPTVTSPSGGNSSSGGSSGGSGGTSPSSAVGLKLSLASVIVAMMGGMMLLA